jgi:hypothetical protein
MKMGLDSGCSILRIEHFGLVANWTSSRNLVKGQSILRPVPYHSTTPMRLDPKVLVQTVNKFARFVGHLGNGSTWKSKSANAGDICAPFLC